jgi:hypothetical protein
MSQEELFSCIAKEKAQKMWIGWRRGGAGGRKVVRQPDGLRLYR